MSIVEVLIAIGVATIGLLGLVILVTAAGLQARDGLRNDNAAAAGRIAFRELQVRQMVDSDMWVTSTGNFTPTAGQPFCLDPMYVATAGSKAFPAGAGVLPRISLRSQPGATGFMSSGQANEIFEFRDDLVFSEATGALPPQQQWVGGNVKREALGNLTWFATFAPTTTANDQYLVSVVIVVGRSRDFNNSSGAYDGYAERVVSVNNLNGVWRGGGDVVLSTTASSEGEGREKLNLRVDNWIMLRDVVGSAQLIRWYRIAQAGEITISGSTYSRHVTLVGADWPGSNTPTGVVVDGALAVFEKTYTIERASMWAP